MNDSLNYKSDYICPVCRHGRISTLPLMEAFACNFCQHLFKADLQRQLLTLIDSQFPITWQWNRRNWTRINSEVEMDLSYLVVGILFVLLPTTIIGLASYLFPPLPGSPLAWLPLCWTVITFFSHLSCLLWLLLDYYQFPLKLYLRAIIQR